MGASRLATAAAIASIAASLLVPATVAAEQPAPGSAGPPPAPAPAVPPPEVAPPGPAPTDVEAVPPPAPAAEPAPGQLPPAAPPPEEEVVPPPPSYGDASPPPAADTSCVPACRSGYVCAGGQCVSACNPPCPEGQQCTATASCEMAAAPSGVGWSGGGAHAPPTDPRDLNKHMHDGFFLRGTLGFGGTWFEETFDDGSAELDGGGMALALDVGGSLTENLVLHGRLGISGASDTGAYDADAIHTIDGYDETNLGLAFLGPGLTYYFMPVNIYLTGVLGIAAGGVTSAESDATEDDNVGATGAVFGIDAGWEAWISKQAGLGAALRLQYFSGEHEAEFSIDETTEMRILTFGLVGSFTYQ